MEIKLPTGDYFTVPKNLYIIGTMNTADKSIALLDIALRRRFEFESMYPKTKIEGQKIYHPKILDSINKQIISKGKGHDFTIGHSYFMNNDNIEQIMNKKVIPLLTEYFMNSLDDVKEIINETGEFEILKNTWPLQVKKK